MARKYELEILLQVYVYMVKIFISGLKPKFVFQLCNNRDES